jgi:hypothetical protein
MLMKTVLSFVSGRKRGPVCVAVACCALALFSGCVSRKEFQKGYERGAADTVKRQYWILRNLQKGKQEPAYRLTYYRFTIPPDPNAPVKTVPRDIAIPIYE